MPRVQDLEAAAPENREALLGHAGSLHARPVAVVHDAREGDPLGELAARDERPASADAIAVAIRNGLAGRPRGVGVEPAPVGKQLGPRGGAEKAAQEAGERVVPDDPGDRCLCRSEHLVHLESLGDGQLEAVVLLRDGDPTEPRVHETLDDLCREPTLALRLVPKGGQERHQLACCRRCTRRHPVFVALSSSRARGVGVHDGDVAVRRAP